MVAGENNPREIFPQGTKENERQGTRTDLYPDIVENFPQSSNLKVADEYVKLRGYGQGGDRKSNRQVGALKLSDIAAELGTSKRDLQRILRIERNLTNSMMQQEQLWKIFHRRYL